MPKPWLAWAAVRDLTYVGEGIIPAPLHGPALRHTPLPKGDVDAIAIHHWTGWTPPETWTADEEEAYILVIDEYHRTGRGLDGIGYQVCPFPSGRVYITARLDCYGAGVGGENDHTIHIGLPGTFNLQIPSAQHRGGAVESTACIYRHLGRDVPTRPHLYWPASGTTCPGDKWPLWVPQLQAQALTIEEGTDEMTPEQFKVIMTKLDEIINRDTEQFKVIWKAIEATARVTRALSEKQIKEGLEGVLDAISGLSGAAGGLSEAQAKAIIERVRLVVG